MGAYNIKISSSKQLSESMLRKYIYKSRLHTFLAQVVYLHAVERMSHSFHKTMHAFHIAGKGTTRVVTRQCNNHLRLEMFAMRQHNYKCNYEYAAEHNDDESFVDRPSSYFQLKRPLINVKKHTNEPHPQYM